MKINEIRMVDVSGPGKIQIELSKDERTLWVNVDEICLLRAQVSPFTQDQTLNVSLEGFHESHLG